MKKILFLSFLVLIAGIYINETFAQSIDLENLLPKAENYEHVQQTEDTIEKVVTINGKKYRVSITLFENNKDASTYVSGFLSNMQYKEELNFPNSWCTKGFLNGQVSMISCSKNQYAVSVMTDQTNGDKIIKEMLGKIGNTSFTDSISSGGGCLIATAAYGSELAPQVQQLRELRDSQLLQTASGTSFMKSFNEFYYLFSPTIADWERENPTFKEAVKLTLTPMISSLSILNYVDMDSENKVLGYGISLILLNVGMYFVAPVIVINTIRKNLNHQIITKVEN